METTNEQKKILQTLQNKIEHYGQYTICPENNYCFGVYGNDESITKTLIEDIESEGYPLLHCQIKDGRLICRFTYQ